jgi:hypothetical protein
MWPVLVTAPFFQWINSGNHEHIKLKKSPPRQSVIRSRNYQLSVESDAMFTRASYWTLSWASLVHFIPSGRIKVKVWVELSLCRHEDVWGSLGISPFFLKPGARWRWVSGKLNVLAALSRRNNPHYPLNRRLDVFLTSLDWRRAKCLAFAGNRIAIPQSIAYPSCFGSWPCLSVHFSTVFPSVYTRLLGDPFPSGLPIKTVYTFLMLLSYRPGQALTAPGSWGSQNF